MGPLVSLITPSYNMARFLPETIESVLGQTYGRIEYRVLDGGSTDGTVELLEGYGERVSWRSERDGGAAEAIGLGMAEAHGTILGWVNADDVLMPRAVEEAVETFETRREAVAVYGRGDWITVEGERIAEYPTVPGAAAEFYRTCGICQPACFFRAEAYRAAGGIDAGWGSAFDYDLWIRLASEGAFVHVPKVWAKSRMHRDNKTLGNRGQAFEEGMAVIERHFGYVPAEWIHSYEMWRKDGRDQFFEEARGSIWTWVGSLPEGMRRNRKQLRRYLWDWFTLPGWAARLRARSG